MAAHYEFKRADAALVEEIQNQYNLPHFVATTMVAHGVTSVEKAHEFLNPDLDRDWRNPYEIPQMKEACDRVEHALRNNERIMVFGDFDLDGISATTVLTRGLRDLGAEVVPLIPHRFDEGYSLSEKAIERAASYEPHLIVTVDNGISAAKEVEYVLAKGIDIVITDHHEPGENVPQGVVVADPKCDKTCKSGILAGVGVALKMIQILGSRFGHPHLWREYTDLATLGTVADLMPLIEENRALVADGLRRINENPRPCIQALIEQSGAGGKELTSNNLSFSLIPRLNAAGRMGDADLALNLLLEDDSQEAKRLAQQLEGVNDERRAIEAELTVLASAQANDMYQGQRVLVVAGEGWHEGVKGIVASRLVSTYGVPCILFSIENGEARGSGRSVGKVNLFEALASTSDLLTRFGGHSAAVGVTLPVANLPEFVDRLCSYMDALPETEFRPSISIDALINLEDLTLDNIEMLNRLAPFGQENPMPRFLARSVRLASRRAVGAQKNHLSTALTDGSARVDGIMFHCDGMDKLVECDHVVDVVFEAQIDEWRGKRKVKCMIQAIEPMSSCPALRACLPREDLEFVGDLYDDWHNHDSEVFVEADLSSVSDQRQTHSNHFDSRTLQDTTLLRKYIIEVLIGKQTLHEQQTQALNALDEGRSLLATMATGRGKSLIFQAYAAQIALQQKQVSILVFPLRALIADQLFHMNKLFASLGVSAVALTGETSSQERKRIYNGLAAGEIHVVLTTPEFIQYNLEDLARVANVGFMVVDEAHHMAQRGAQHRAGYDALAQARVRFGNPVMLALTATAPAPIAHTIYEAIKSNYQVTDSTQRMNLSLDDRRGLRDKESYIANIIASGGKTIIYLNSRLGTIDLARRLRALVPQIAMQIGFYNAGLTTDERHKMEQLFRRGVIQVMVCTSAFGEGVNIPDVRHVILYDMPFSDIEFNQMSGRAGRDGQPSEVHILFGSQEANMCERILRSQAPVHDDMAQIYRELKRLQANHGGIMAKIVQSSQTAQETLAPQGTMAAAFSQIASQDDAIFTTSDEELAQMCSSPNINAQAVASGVRVFSELGLVSQHNQSNTAKTAQRSMMVPDVTSRVELTDSVYYREGLEEIEAFLRFKKWVLYATTNELHDKIIGPLTPFGQ
ncbi:MAG: single-stranded-DNA-specific exonuclease RecJ [Eggerthellaceae bacterium]|nr:single-stranded-DNA-specific exonuclease RecJ [Eggerthellaceae bacterium]